MIGSGKTLKKPFRRSPWWRLAAMAVVVLSFAYIGRMFLANAGTLRQQHFTLHWPMLVLALAFMPFTAGLSNWCWYRILQLLGEKPRFMITFRIATYASIVRYLPGRIWNYVGKVYWGRKAGHSEKKILLSNVLDLMFLLLSAALVSVPSVGTLIPSLPPYVLVGGAALVLICIHPRLLELAINRFGRRWIASPVTLGFSFVHVLILTFAYVVNWYIMGAQLFFFIRSFYPLPFHHMPLFSSFNASSWLVGYLSIIAPAGLGVKESAFTFAFQTMVPVSIAALAALLIRLFAIIMDVTAAGIFFLLDPGARRNFVSTIRMIRTSPNAAVPDQPDQQS